MKLICELQEAVDYELVEASGEKPKQYFIEGIFNPGISSTWALPSGEAALNSIKCFVSNSWTSGLSKLPSIDFNIYNKVVRCPIFLLSLISVLR